MINKIQDSWILNRSQFLFIHHTSYIIILFCLLSTASCLLSTAALAQDPLPEPVVEGESAPAVTPASGGGSIKRLKDFNLPGLDEKIYIDTTAQWGVDQFLDFLGQKANLKNMIISKSVAGMTTKLKLNGVTIGDAMEVVLSVNNLAYEVKGGIITIMSDEEYKLKNGVSFYDAKKVKMIELKYADPARVAAMLDKVRSTIGLIVSDTVTGTIILLDTPDKIAEMSAIIEKTDIATVSRVIPTETQTYVLQYAELEPIQAELATVISKEAGSLKVDKRTRTVIVSDLPHIMKKVDNIIKTFDVPSKQVFIEAKIVEVALSDDYALGVNWQHVLQAVNPRSTVKSFSQAANLTMPGGILGGTQPSGGTLAFSTVDAGLQLDLLIQAMKKIGDTKILSNPQITVMDGAEATIEVIEDQPYKETTMESGTTNITGVTYLFKKVGVMLNVKPKINQDGFISCMIKPEISSISAWYDGSAQNGTPVIKKATAETSVMVKDGVTIIIGGLIKDRKDDTDSRVPFLGRIPLIGLLFKQKVESTLNSETVIFLTPRIVTGAEPIQRMRDLKKEIKPVRASGPASSVPGGPSKPMKPVR